MDFRQQALQRGSERQQSRGRTSHQLGVDTAGAGGLFTPGPIASRMIILDLRGLKCPLPALRTRKALRQAEPGARLRVECTDPLSVIDIPNLVRETGDTLEASGREGDVLMFSIAKAPG